MSAKSIRKMVILYFQVMEAIYYGVPMVGMPVFNDQVKFASKYDYTMSKIVFLF